MLELYIANGGLSENSWRCEVIRGTGEGMSGFDYSQQQQFDNNYSWTVDVGGWQCHVKWLISMWRMVLCLKCWAVHPSWQNIFVRRSQMGYFMDKAGV